MPLWPANKYKSVKEAGAEKIEDIVDPAERERLQAVNDMLEAQLELKKQISKDADDKANTDTSAVVNDKSENSIVKSSTQPQVSYDSNGNPITIFSPTPDKVTKTESLQEYTAALEDTTQKRRDLQVELDQIEASSGKDSKEYANKKKELDALNEAFESQKTKVEELSSAVSEQMGNYKTDADSFAQYKDEYVAGTNTMTAATKALADAQDDTSVDTTNVDIFAEKVSAVKASMSRRGTNDSKGNSYIGAVNEFSGMTGDAVLNIDADTEHQTEAESNALKILHETADKAHINAVYDICEYVSGYFRDKQLSDLRPVEIYAMTKVNLEQSVVSDKDAITIKMGNDFTFSDVEEKVLFNEPKIFTGKNYVDTGVSLLSEDRSWVMALDYRIDEDSAANSVIAQCFQTNGMNGFRFWVNNGSKVAWGTESTNGAHLGARDMIVLRHTKGENGIHVYAANTTAAEIGYIQLNRTRTTQTNATLVFGCAKADDGAYERYAKGTIYWGKLWYTDLGDAACRKLAAWTHEDFTFEACGFKQYYLSDNSNKRCSISFIQAGLLGQKMALNTGSTNTGGWASANIRTFLDGRILNALPIGWQQIIKQVKVGSTIGDKSSEVVTADSYFYLPSVAELFPSQNVEPYIYEGTAISFMTDNTSRICNDENGNPAAYWTRSPNAQYGSYFWSVTVTGEYYGFTPANNEQGIRLMFSV